MITINEDFLQQSISASAQKEFEIAQKAANSIIDVDGFNSIAQYNIPIIPDIQLPKSAFEISSLEEEADKAFVISNTMLETLQNTALTINFDAVLSAYAKLNEQVCSKVLHILKDAQSALDSLIQSPAIEWLQSIDFSSIFEDFNAPNLDFAVNRYEELNKAYLTAMYECKWFPYAGWTVSVRLFSEVTDILDSSCGASKRREKRIDKAVLSYYDNYEIKSIKRSWKNSKLEPHIKRILGQALEAHLRGEYALTITTLATMWEGLIKSKLLIISENPKADFEKLVDDNGFNKIFSDFYNNLIIGTCYSVEEVVDGVPNRHGTAHGWYKKYPNKKASLNAILLTDFIIKLEPKKKSEDKTNGQAEDAQC